MPNRFGPWSSALGDGLSPHLSTFWKRRLALLASARASRPTLTRRDWLKMSAVGATACALPTIHFATADEPVVANAADPGKIYIHANLVTGVGNDSVDGIFAVDPETANWTKISDLGDQIRVSRDGKTLALSRSGKNADGTEIDGAGVWTLDVEGAGEKRQVADFGGLTSWSPDGKQLIVMKWLSKPQDDNMLHETWRFNVDGSDAAKLPIPETDEVDDWSPDGKWFVTVSDRHPPNGSGYQLYIMRPDGTEQRRLTEGGGLNVYPRFSPDSRRIAYLHQEHSENSLWVVNLDGTGRRLLLKEENDTMPDHFCWSPDGKSLACLLEDWERDEAGKKFISDPEKANRRIVIISDDGKKTRPLDLPRAKWIGAPDWR
jgi:tricorn protease-like protein